MTRTKAFTAQRLQYINRAGRVFTIIKGASRYAKYYVTDVESGRYLTNGVDQLLDAQIEAERLG